MKKLRLYFLAVFLLSMASCDPRNFQPLYTVYTPIIMERESLERSISFHTPVPIADPAKIYYKDHFIFISERYKGVHVIDNADPQNPVNKGYIEVAGGVDMAIKSNTLYVDNAVDLVAIDLSKIASSKIEVTKRVKDNFPELSPPDGLSVPSKYLKANRPVNTVIVGWEKKKL